MMPSRVMVVEASAFFTPGRPYDVQRWERGWPRVLNDAGTWTWLHTPRWWVAVPGSEVPASKRYSP